MGREINPPDEIIRRIIFIIYLAGWLSAVTLSVMGIAQNRLSLVALGLLIGVLNIFLRRFGKRSLEFDRLIRSFPFGSKEDEIPVQFDLGIVQETTVVLSEDVTINGARVDLNTGGLNIYNAPATVVLPAGTNLPSGPGSSR